MIGGINYASSQIASVYNTGSQQLATTLTRIASGKKFQNASDDLSGYLKAQGLESGISGYEQVRVDLTEFKSYTAAALQASSSAYEALSEMKELATKYDATSDTDLQAEYTADFNALKSQVTETIANSYVDGDLVTAAGSIKTVNLDPDGTGTLDMNFSAIADASSLVITSDTAVADVQAQATNMLTYMSEAKSFDAIVDQQLNLSTTIINSKKAAMSLITDIDEAEEMNNVIDLSVRQQAGVAMMAQANMVQSSIAKLYDM